MTSDAPSPEQSDETSQRLQVYGRRRGRPLRQRKSHLVETLLPRVKIDVSAVNLCTLFSFSPSDVWLEVGFGGGEHLAVQAESHPSVGFIGAEFFMNGVASLLDHVDRKGLENVRIWPGDARPLIDALPDQSVGRCFVLFPDPWPKKRHADRRFIGPANLDRLARILKDGAELRLATDDPTLLPWMLEHMLAHAAFQWTEKSLEECQHRPADWPPTRYEQKAIAAGRTPHFLIFTRVSR